MLRLFTALWLGEILLGRISSGAPVSAWDLALSGAVLVGLGALGLALARRLPARPGTALRGTLVAGAASFVLLGIAFHPDARPGGHGGVSEGAAAARALALLAIAGGLATGLARGEKRRLAPAAALGGVALAAGLAWDVIGWPGAGRLVALVLAGAGLAAVSLRPALLAGAAAAVVLFALTPARPAPPTWTAAAPGAAAQAATPRGPDPAAAGPARPMPPDIVLLTVDTLRRDEARRMESYARLAERGVAYEAALAPAPWTLPSMATLFTAEPPTRHGARMNAEGGLGAIPEELPTLAERLRAEGYDTAAVVGPNGLLTEAYGFARGFAVFEHAIEARVRALPGAPDAWDRGRPLAARLLDPWLPAARGGALSDASVAARALHVLAHRRPGRPLFLWVHLFEPHLPYRHLDAPLEGAPLPWPERARLRKAWRLSVVAQKDHFTSPRGQATLRAVYRNEVARSDRALGGLLDHLERRASRPALVVLTSDHGEELFEHGGYEHGHALWEEVIGVPLVVARLNTPSPHPAAGSRDATPVGLEEVGRMLGDTASRGAPAPLRPAPRQVVSHLLYAKKGRHDAHVAVREGPWKLIRSPGEPARLFDLAADPDERRNLAAARPQRREALAAALPDARAPGAAQGEPEPIDAETRRVLQALGYLEE